MKVVDNFLSSAYQNAIENTLLDVKFPWYLYSSTALVGKEYNTFGAHNTTDAPQFIHGFCQHNEVHSEHYPLVIFIAHQLMFSENIDTTEILRIKANLNTPSNNYPDNHHYTIHTDCETPAITCIYYVNDSDGDTIFFTPDGAKEINRVTPKKGRAVFFDTSIPHAGTPPRNNTHRCLINLLIKQRN